jgi:hypothetical protein
VRTASASLPEEEPAVVGELTPGETEGGTPGAGPLFTLAFHEAFSSAPQVVVVSDGGTDATVGTTTANDVIIETTKTLTNGNSYTVKLLIVG